MKEPITFAVFGKPEPAGSKKAWVLRKGGVFTGRAIVTDANAKSKPWQQTVKHEALRAIGDTNNLFQLWDCPIVLTLRFTVERPKSHYRSGANADKLKDSAPAYPISKPDATKLCRGVEDALTGIIWTDDARIVTQHITKRYGRPGVVIEIREACPE